MESESASQQIIDLLKELPKKFLGINLQFKIEQNCTEEKLLEIDDFSITTNAKKFGGFSKNLRIHTGPSSLLEEDLKDNRITLKFPLFSIIEILVKNKPDTVTLKLIQNHGNQYKISNLKPQEADYLISNILYAIQTKDDMDTLIPPIYIEPTEQSMKIHAMNGEIVPNFENSLKKELEDLIGKGNILDTKLRDLILDAALNMSFKSFGYDQKFMSVLFGILADLTQVLLKFENDPIAQENYKNFLKTKTAISEPISEKMDSGKLLFEVSRRIPILLSLIKNYLLWRTAIPEISVLQKQIEILTSLASCRHNSIISIMASLTLRNLLKVNKSQERRLEYGKKWAIRELDIINKLVECISVFKDKTTEEFLSKIKHPEIIHNSPVFFFNLYRKVFTNLWLDECF